MDEVRAEVDNNPEEYADGRGTIISIVDAAEEICASLAAGDVTDLSVTPELTATPNPTIEALETLIPESSSTTTP
jgi:hypothetical protein